MHNKKVPHPKDPISNSGPILTALAPTAPRRSSPCSLPTSLRWLLLAVVRRPASPSLPAGPLTVVGRSSPRPAARSQPRCTGCSSPSSSDLLHRRPPDCLAVIGRAPAAPCRELASRSLAPPQSHVAPRRAAPRWPRPTAPRRELTSRSPAAPLHPPPRGCLVSPTPPLQAQEVCVAVRA